jgi:hypothetical protein
MRLQIVRAGVLENFLPQVSTLEYNGRPVLRDLIHQLEIEKGPGLADEILAVDGLKPDIAILVNGKSIRAQRSGLNTQLHDDDVIVFCIIVDGG